MTNYEILVQNNEKLSYLLAPKISYNSQTYDIEEIINFKIEYNYIDLVSMLSYDNKLFCKKIYIILDDLGLEIDGQIIFDRSNKNLYLIYFDPNIYYENVNLKVKLQYKFLV